MNDRMKRVKNEMGYKEFRNLSALGFKSRCHHYVYDRFSNEILRVDPVVFDVLDDSFELSAGQIVEKHAGQFSETDIRKALLTIAEVQEKKSALRPFPIPQFSVNKNGNRIESVRKELDAELTQLTFNVTERCNLRCEYCVYSGGYSDRREHNNSNDIELSLATRAVDFFHKHSRKPRERYLSLYGGEPLLRIGFVKGIIEYAKRVDPGIRVAITTNGTLLNERLVEFLAANDVALTISIDGPRELHDAYRKYANKKGTFDTVIKNIGMIRNKFPDYCADKVKLNSVIAPCDGEIDEIEKFFSCADLDFCRQPQKYSSGLVNPQENDFMERHGYNDYVQDYYEVMLKQYLKSHLASDDPSNMILANALLSKQMKMIYMRSNRRLSEYEFFWPNGICIPGARSLFVSADGQFYPCEKLYDYGDMAIGDIDAGFDSARIAGLVDEYCNHTVDNCRHCWAYRLCGECFLTVHERGSWNEKKRSDFCVGQKSVWACVMAVYSTILESNADAFDYFLDERPAGVQKPEGIKDIYGHSHNIKQ